MNRIYKVIWSKARNCYVAVSELAKNHTKGCSGSRAGRMLTVGAVAAALLLPMGEAGAFVSSDSGYQYDPSTGNSYYFYSKCFSDNGAQGGLVEQIQYNYLLLDQDGNLSLVKSDSTPNYYDNSSQQFNTAIGNGATASGPSNYGMVYSQSLTVYSEVKPDNWNGRSTWGRGSDGVYKQLYSTGSSGYMYGGTSGDTIYYNKDTGKFYEGRPEYIYDENNNYVGQEYKWTELGENFFKLNENGQPIKDYKKVDENEYPIYDLTWSDMGLDNGNYNNVAIGPNATTTSNNSVAIGDSSSTNGWRGVAVGAMTKAEGAETFAAGSASTARGWRSIAIGAEAEAGQENGSSWNNGTSAVAIGNSAKAYGATSVAVGNNSQTYSFSGIAVGNGANASTEYGIAIGDNARIAYINGADRTTEQRTAAQSIAIGRDALAQAKDVTAVGRNAQGMMRNATAYGNNAHANAWNSIAIGNKATAGLQADIVNDDGTAKDGTIGNSAVAIGNRARAESEYTTAIGAGTWAEGTHAVAVGDSNRATGKFSTAIGAGWSINHTEGEPDSDDAKDGSDAINSEGDRTYESIGSNQAAGDYSSAVDYGNKTVGVQSNAFGKENEVSGVSSLGVGSGNKVGTIAIGDDGVLEEKQENKVSGYAVGSYNTITGSEKTNAGAFGAGNTVAGDNGYAVGNFNKITEGATEALAVGSSNEVSGEDSYAVGNGNKISGKTSIAVGYGNEVSGDNSGAFGDPNVVTGSNSYAFGNNNTVAGDYSVAVGDENTIDKAAHRSFTVGYKASATVEDAVALGSNSVAARGKSNGGAGAGFDVTTGTNYAGADKDTATWTSTLGAVSVGGDSADGAIGKAATATRQITGVAAGTADTDAVNVAQLKLATAGSKENVNPGTNVTVNETINADGTTVYTVNGLKTVVTSVDGSVVVSPTNEDNADGTGVITYDLKVKPATNVKVSEGDNVTVEEKKEGDVTNYVISAKDTKTKVTSADGSVTVTGGTETDGVITYDLSVNATDTVTNIKAGDNVHVTEVKTGDVITYTIDADASIVEEGDNVTVTPTKDASTHTTKYKVSAKDTVTNVKAGDDSVTVDEKIDGDKITYTLKAKNTRIKEVKSDYSTVNDTSNKGKLTVTDTDGNTFETEVQDTYTTKAELKADEHKAVFTRNDGGTYELNGIATENDITNIYGDINKLGHRINKVGAGAAALAGLHPLDFDPDEKWDFSAAAGSYKSEQAVALGAFYRPNEDTMFSIAGTIGNGNNMVNVGVSWKFGQKNRISANRISSAKEIIELRKNQENVHSFLADAVAGNQLDLSKIQLFPDVEENHWAYDYVATMAGNGVLEGYPDGYFKGNRNMTRYEMAAVLYRLMQNGARLSDRALTEFAPELDRIRVDTITQHQDGTPHIQRVRTIKERVDEKADPSSEKAAKKKAKVKVAEKLVE
ncbi:MAG: YadA-like family protein [Acidaminococcaceae bacterium]|nr:YadA-like family protein [Acidaminococcaceae bacterium]